MNDFDINQFESRVDALLAAYARLQADHHALEAAHAHEAERNQRTRNRLKTVIERIRALEAEAEIDDVEGA